MKDNLVYRVALVVAGRPYYMADLRMSLSRLRYDAVIFADQAAALHAASEVERRYEAFFAPYPALGKAEPVARTEVSD